MGYINFAFLFLFLNAALAQEPATKLRTVLPFSDAEVEARETKGFELAIALLEGKLPGKDADDRAGEHTKRFEALDGLGQRAVILKMVDVALHGHQPKDDLDYQLQAREARRALLRIKEAGNGKYIGTVEHGLAQLDSQPLAKLKPVQALNAALLEFEASEDLGSFFGRLRESPSTAWSEGAVKTLEAYKIFGPGMKEGWRRGLLSVMEAEKADPVARARLTRELANLELAPEENTRFIKAVVAHGDKEALGYLRKALDRDVPNSAKQLLALIEKADQRTLPALLNALLDSRQAGALTGAKAILRGLIGKPGTDNNALGHLLLQTGDTLEDFPDEKAKRAFLKGLLANEEGFQGRLLALRALEKKPDLELFDDVMRTMHQRDRTTLSGFLLSGKDVDLEALKKQIPLSIAAYARAVPGMSKRLLKEIETGKEATGADPKNLAALALKGVAQPGDFDDIFRAFQGSAGQRILNRNLAETLGSIAPFLRGPQRTNAMKSLTDYLGKRDPAQQVSQRMLRGRLPRPVMNEIEGELDKQVAAANPKANVCDTICGIFDKAGEWGGVANTDQPEAYYNKGKPTEYWKGATRSLKLLFLESARPFCQKDAKPDKKLTGELAVLAAQLRKQREDEVARIAADKERKPLSIDDVPTEHMTAEEKKVMTDFLNQANGSSTWVPTNSVEAYGNLFASLLARNLKENGLEVGGKGGLNPDEIERIAQLPVEIGANQNSLGTTHLIASALVAAVPKTPEERQKIDKILAQLEANRVAAAKVAKADGIPDSEAKHHFPYSNRANDIREEHPEGSRARGPLVRLAFYLHDRTNRNESRANLIEASDYFVQDFAKIFGTIGDERYEGQAFHDAYDHSRATYYATSNVLYVAAGLELAQRDPNATKEQKEKAASVKASLRLRLLGQMKNGLFKPQNPKLFPAAAAYDNPHVGLAFLSLLDPKQDKCRSGKIAEPTTGVVDATAVEKLFETVPAPKAAPAPDKATGGKPNH